MCTCLITRLVICISECAVLEKLECLWFQSSWRCVFNFVPVRADVHAVIYRIVLISSRRSSRRSSRILYASFLLRGRLHVLFPAVWWWHVMWPLHSRAGYVALLYTVAFLNTCTRPAWTPCERRRTCANAYKKSVQAQIHSHTRLCWTFLTTALKLYTLERN